MTDIPHGCAMKDVAYGTGWQPTASTAFSQSGIPNADTEQLIWDAEQALRALQDRFVDPGELWNLKRLVDKLETQQ